MESILFPAELHDVVDISGARSRPIQPLASLNKLYHFGVTCPSVRDLSACEYLVTKENTERIHASDKK